MVLTEASIRQIDRKLAEAVACGYATVCLVVRNGRFQLIEGPAPSVKVREKNPSP
jgi:hypothetical protein